MNSSVLRSAGRALGRSVPQGPSRRSPVSAFAGKTQSSKYSTSSSGLQVKGVSYRDLLVSVDELTRVVAVLKKEFKELKLVLEKKDAIVRRCAWRMPFKMLAGASVSFALGFYLSA